jgi:hypothetical protein
VDQQGSHKIFGRFFAAVVSLLRRGLAGSACERVTLQWAVSAGVVEGHNALVVGFVVCSERAVERRWIDR